LSRDSGSWEKALTLRASQKLEETFAYFVVVGIFRYKISVPLLIPVIFLFCSFISSNLFTLDRVDREKHEVAWNFLGVVLEEGLDIRRFP